MKPYFLNVVVKMTDRSLEEKDDIKSENVTIELEYVSSGNTSKITNSDIIEQISKQLKRLI